MLRFSATFTSPLPAPAARNGLVVWLQSIGYRLTSPAFLSAISLERGSAMGNMSSLSPSKWSARCQASFTPKDTGTEVTIEWTVSTFGQIVTKADMRFWQLEAEWTLGAACGQAPNVRDHVQASSKAYGGNVWRALLFTFLLLIPSLFLGGYFGSVWIGLAVCAVMGAASWYALRAPRAIGELRPPPPRPDAPPVLQ